MPAKATPPMHRFWFASMARSYKNRCVGWMSLFTSTMAPLGGWPPRGSVKRDPPYESLRYRYSGLTIPSS